MRSSSPSTRKRVILLSAEIVAGFLFWLFSNKNLTNPTKLAVYQASVLFVLLYGAEICMVHYKHSKILESFHIKCLQYILDVSWEGRLPHRTILERCNSFSIKSLIVKCQLHWTDHLIRMPTPASIVLSSTGTDRTPTVP
uniref:Uncharacterized protein n=1 Tax=Octopus bimaculoides TaxID=37653 RepID=A0A0L8H499_OCTBM